MSSRGMDGRREGEVGQAEVSARLPFPHVSCLRNSSKTVFCLQLWILLEWVHLAPSDPFRNCVGQALFSGAAVNIPRDGPQSGIFSRGSDSQLEMCGSYENCC